MTGRTIPPLLTKPPVESFFDFNHAHALWPTHITARADFRAQLQAQQALLHSVQTVFTALPCGTTLLAGLEAGLLTEAMVIAFQDDLTQYLNTDSAYKRIIFYLPFEFTSPIKSGSDELRAASDRFQKRYRRVWEAMLCQYDVRANFLDGDVLEVEKRTGDLPRVVKVTHLIPGLIESGHLTFQDVIAYAADSNDTLVKKGIREACAVLRDRGLISQHDIDTFRQSTDCSQSSGYEVLLPQATKVIESKPIRATEAIERLMMDIEVAKHTAERGATLSRIQWLQTVATEKAIACAAAKLCVLLKAGMLLPDIEACNTVTVSAYIEAVRLVSLETKHLDTKHHDWLATVRHEYTEVTVQDAIDKLYRHAWTAGILTNRQRSEEHVLIPSLAGPFSKNLPNFTPSVSACNRMVEQISGDDYLATRVYPVGILLGSQLKGYGIRSADADVAVFIQPGTANADYEEMTRRLRDIFSHERIGGSAIMFWLERRHQVVTIVKATDTKGVRPLNSWTHVLMGGAWIGDETEVRSLQYDLLTPYLFNPTIVEEGMPVRERWLEEMERDSILYRLLHKGFARYYPVCSPFDTVHGQSIDGTSAFYDPMFRRIATQLFLTRVFFPNLD